MKQEIPTQLKSPKNAQELIDMYFLDIRSALLETAAFFDRLERSENGKTMLADNPQVQQLKEACNIIQSSEDTSRTERILCLLSEE